MFPLSFTLIHTGHSCADCRSILARDDQHLTCSVPDQRQQPICLWRFNWVNVWKQDNSRIWKLGLCQLIGFVFCQPPHTPCLMWKDKKDLNGVKSVWARSRRRSNPAVCTVGQWSSADGSLRRECFYFTALTFTIFKQWCICLTLDYINKLAQALWHVILLISVILYITLSNGWVNTWNVLLIFMVPRGWTTLN